MRERKADHIEICVNERIAPEHCYWDDIKLMHEALPEVDYDQIDTEATIMGCRLGCPLMVTAITGGFPGAKRINANIAEACSRLQIGMGVGSQRAALQGIDPDSFSVIADYDIPFKVANLGAPQLIRQKGKEPFTEEDMDTVMEMIGADALAVHLNFLQEVVQPEGDTMSVGCYDRIREVARGRSIIIKETGAGISRSTAERLKGVGIKAMDISGMGGTSFSAVEMYRARKVDDRVRERIGQTFFDWGIPAPASLLIANVGLPLIASGGVENGLHAAKAVAMGATIAGTANSILKEAMESADAVEKRLREMAEEIKAAMLLTGSKDLKALSGKEYILTGPVRDWIQRS